MAAFLVSPFGAAERTWKPFNPLLGETFELEGLGAGVRFMAEQVRGARFCLCERVQVMLSSKWPLITCWMGWAAACAHGGAGGCVFLGGWHLL